MKNIAVVDLKGKTVGKFAIDQTLFNEKCNKTFLRQTVLLYLANLRKGCASTKTSAQVRGGGRKPWRQKGTGRARVGSIRSPLWRGGGVTFGPHPHSYNVKLPKGIKRRALIQSLNGKIKDNQLVIVNQIALKNPKTKELVSFLTALKAKDKTLIIVEKYHPDIVRAGRNISGVSVKAFNNINAHDVLKHNKVIFSQQALENLIKLRKD